MLNSRFFFSLLGAMAVLAFSALVAVPVKADVAYTQQAQVDVTSVETSPPLLGANPPIDDVIQLAFGENGRIFTNTFAPAPPTGPPPGGASDVRSVGIVRLDNLSQNGGAGSDFNGIRRNGNRVVGVFGVQGFVETTLGPGAANARFTEGKVWFYEVNGGVNPDFLDPTTWDPANDLTLITEYTLKSQVFGEGVDPVAGVFAGGPRDSLAPGPNGQQIVPIAASDIDVSGVNTAVGALGQGDFLFVETANGMLADDPFIDLTYTTDLGEDREPAFPPGAGPPRDEEGIHAVTQQTILALLGLTDPDSLGNAHPGSAASAAQEAVLDAIAMAAFGDAFATWGSGVFSDWLPGTFPGNPFGEGDFIASLSSNVHPIAQAGVPEPGSLAMWGLGLLASVSVARRRQRNAANN